MRISRPCYNKPHRCPGWVGGGVRSARVDRCPDEGAGKPYVTTRPRWLPEVVLSDGGTIGGYWQDHPGANQWRWGRCGRCGVRTWPYVVRWTSWGFVWGWQARPWLREWGLYRFEDGITDWHVGRRDSTYWEIAIWRWVLTNEPEWAVQE